MDKTTNIVTLTGVEASCLVKLLREELTADIISVSIEQTLTPNHYRDSVLILQLKDKKVKYTLKNDEVW